MQLSRTDPLLAAALALPGLALQATEATAAGSAPTESVLDLRYSHYEDFQPGAERMKIWAPSLFWLAPAGANWSVATTLLADSMSGASPLFHDTLSGASGKGVVDFRRAGDLAVTHYFGRAELTVGLAFSDEADYDSGALRLSGSIDSADRNQTWTFGLAGSNDSIDSVNGLAVDRFRRLREAQLGWTRILDPLSFVALGLSYGDGRGYYDDPYKPLDFRPSTRRQRVATARYHRHFPGAEGSLRLGLRWYDDSWSIAAHSLDLAWEQSFGATSITPLLRYHTQSAARFYTDPPFGSAFVLGQPHSGDTRLAAFGALTAGLELKRRFGVHWSGELRFDFYRQRPGWRVFGTGSPDILPLSARIFEIGLRRTW